MKNNYEVAYTMEVFGDGDGQYFYTVEMSEKKRWRVKPIITRLGHGQTESHGEAMEACKRVLDLFLSTPDLSVDAVPLVEE